MLAAAAGGFLLSAPLRYLYRRLWGQRFVVVVPAVLFASWFVALGWRVVINSSYVKSQNITFATQAAGAAFNTFGQPLDILQPRTLRLAMQIKF